MAEGGGDRGTKGESGRGGAAGTDEEWSSRRTHKRTLERLLSATRPLGYEPKRLISTPVDFIALPRSKRLRDPTAIDSARQLHNVRSLLRDFLLVQQRGRTIPVIEWSGGIPNTAGNRSYG